MIKLHDEIIKPTIFPDRTSQVWKLSEDTINKVKTKRSQIIHWQFESESEIFHLLQLLKLMHTTNSNMEYVCLECPQLLFAQQDKLVSNQSTFALRVLLPLLNGYIDELICIDQHSKVCEKEYGLSYKIISHFPRAEIIQAMEITKPDYLVFPDKGAHSRYQDICNTPKVVMDKTRNQLTGQITGMELIIEPPNFTSKDKTFLIVDDICVGGMTFAKCAQHLFSLEDKPKSVNLYTTHGCYSNGLKFLHDYNINMVINKNGLISQKAKI